MKINSLKFILLGFFILSYQQQKISKPTVPNENEIQNNNNMNDKKNKQDAGYLSEFNKEWEKKMSDYESDYLYVIPLNKNTEEIYYEDIEMVPARVRGAFFIEEDL